MRRLAVPIAGAALLVGFAIASLPWGSELLRRPRTPFDRSGARSVAPGYALLAEAARVIPEGASVVVRTEPPDPSSETYFHRFAISLLPRRSVRPAAFYGSPVDPKEWRDAQYLVVIGGKPVPPPGELLLETREGSVWLRSRP